MIQSLIAYLSKPKLQRFVYVLLIPIWTLIWYFDDLQQYPNKSLLELSWIIPSGILLVQALLNHVFIWGFLFLILSLYSIALTYASIHSILQGSEHMLAYIILLLFAFVLLFLFYCIKPTKDIQKL